MASSPLKSVLFSVILLHETGIGLCFIKEDGQIAVALTQRAIAVTEHKTPVVPALEPPAFPYTELGVPDAANAIAPKQEALKTDTQDLFTHSALLSKQLENYKFIVKHMSSRYVQMMQLVGDSITQEHQSLLGREKERLDPMAEITKEINRLAPMGLQHPSDAKIPDKITALSTLEHLDTDDDDMKASTAAAMARMASQPSTSTGGHGGSTPTVSTPTTPTHVVSPSTPIVEPTTPSAHQSSPDAKVEKSSSNFKDCMRANNGDGNPILCTKECAMWPEANKGNRGCTHTSGEKFNSNAGNYCKNSCDPANQCKTPEDTPAPDDPAKPCPKP